MLEILGAPSIRKPKPPPGLDLKFDRTFLDLIDLPNVDECAFDGW